MEVIAGDDREGFIELRAPKTRPAQTFVPVTNLDRAVEVAMKRGHKADMYVGCAPRTERSGRQKAVKHAWAMWADIDGPQGVDLLATFPHKPTLTIASGSPESLHAWWALDKPLPARWIRQATMRLMGALSEPCPFEHDEPSCGLCHHHRLGADPASCDVARVLRVPGTYNHKTKPPRVVQLESDTGLRYDIRTLVGDLADPEPPKPPAKAHPRPPIGSQPLRDIPADEYYERLTGQPARIGRHVKCPLHEDWEPSLMLYRDGSWFCFACRNGGTIYDLAGHMWDMDTRGPEFLALKDRLREEFNVR